MDECDFFCLDSSEGRSGFCCRFIKDDEEEEELWKFHAAAASSESRRQFFIGAKIWRGGNAVRIGLAGSEAACLAAWLPGISEGAMCTMATAEGKGRKAGGRAS